MINSLHQSIRYAVARAALHFASLKAGPARRPGKEALPWWFSLASWVGWPPSLLAPRFWENLPACPRTAEGGRSSAASVFILRNPLVDGGSRWSSSSRGRPGRRRGRVVGDSLGNWPWETFRGFQLAGSTSYRRLGNDLCVGGCGLSVMVLLIYVGLLGLTGFGFNAPLPTGFIPNSRQGSALSPRAIARLRRLLESPR